MVAAVLLALLAHPAFGKCPQGTSMSSQSEQGEWCLFCPDGTSATQTFGDGGVSCTCGKADCSVTLAGKPSTIAAYQESVTDKSIIDPSSEVISEVVSTMPEPSPDADMNDYERTSIEEGNCKGVRVEGDDPDIWTYEGTEVGSISPDMPKLPTPEEACAACEKNPECYFWSCTGSNKGGGCTLYGMDAMKVSRENCRCTVWNGEVTRSTPTSSPEALPTSSPEASPMPSPEASPMPSPSPTPAAPAPESSGNDAGINVNPSASDATMMKQSMVLVSVVIGMLIA